MVRTIHTLALVVAFAAAISACGDTAPPSGGSSSPDTVIDPLDLRYTCGEFPFGPGLLTAGPGNAEQADNPPTAVLRAHLAGDGPDFDFLPDTGWHLIGRDAQTAEFVTVADDLRIFTVSLRDSPEGWQVVNWGECQPRIQLAAGLAAAEWALDPAQPKPDAATQAFDALVTELSCNGGQPAAGRIVGPQIVKSADAVLVIFAVRPRPGDHDCQSNPPTRVKVDLGEPLGERKLLDGGRLPLGEPSHARF